MIVAIGSRGLRSRSAPVRPVPEAPEPSPPPVMMRRRALPAPRVGRWTLPLVGIAAGWLIGSLLAGVGQEGQHSNVRFMDLTLVGLVLVLMIVRRRQPAPARPARGGGKIPREVKMPPVPATKSGDPSAGSDLERGVQDIRRTDPGFDATRFSGYTAMTFRDAQTAWMSRDIASLRARVTPEIYAELEAQCERLRGGRRSDRVDEIEIRARITE